MNKIRTNLEKHMNELCLTIGSRHVGSDGEKLAADYIENEFRRCGYQTVREKYSTTGWNLKSFEFTNQTSRIQIPGAVPCFFSPSAEVEGKLLWLKRGDLAHLDDLSVKGRICMVASVSSQEDVKGRNQIAEELDSLGAAAAIFISDIHTSLAASTKIQRSPFLNQLGCCAVAEEGALELARHKDDVYRIKLEALCFPHESCNVIARVSGFKSSKGVIGAHFDTAPLTQGAGDNASGVAVLLELARLLHEKNNEWNLDFVAFSAEEYIPKDLPPGSGDYVMAHQHEDIRWFLNFDDIGLLLGEPQIRTVLSKKLPPLRSDIFPICPTQITSGDDKSFKHIGVPSVWYRDEAFFKQLHTKRDSIDTIDFEKMTAATVDAAKIFEQLTKDTEK